MRGDDYHAFIALALDNSMPNNNRPLENKNHKIGMEGTRNRFFIASRDKTASKSGICKPTWR